MDALLNADVLLHPPDEAEPADASDEVEGDQEGEDVQALSSE